jgi:thiol-disulfide isomerase/thioredoxin
VGLILSAWWIGPCLAEEVQWRHDYNTARREAQEKDRPLVVDFGTEHCFWCKKLDDTTFRSPSVINVLNQQFIPVKVDAEKNVRLAEALRIQGYPTIVLAASDGKILDTLEGYVEPARFGELLQRTLSKLGTKPGLNGQQRMVEAHELLAQAREDYRTQQFLCCLDRCERLVFSYPDLPEGAEARQLSAEIKNNPEWMRQVCEAMSDRLGLWYLALAEGLIKQEQAPQAMFYLERILLACPGSRHAETAQSKLAQLKGQPTEAAGNKKP